MNQLQTRLLEGHTQTQGSGVMFALQKTLMDMTISHPVSIHCLGNKIQSIPQERAVATYNFLFGSLKHSSRQVIGSPQVKLIHRGGCCKSFTFHLHTTGFETRTIWRSQDWTIPMLGRYPNWISLRISHLNSCEYQKLCLFMVIWLFSLHLKIMRSSHIISKGVICFENLIIQVEY